MAHIEMKFNSVAWEFGNTPTGDDPCVFGMVITANGVTTQLGSGRLSFLTEAALRILKRGPQKEQAMTAHRGIGDE